MSYRIAVLPGDGIGPEVIAEAIRVLKALETATPLRFEFTEFRVGAGEYLESGDPLPDETLAAIQAYDAVLLGAMGIPEVRWPSGLEMTPQIDLREKLDLYCGLRPIRLLQARHSPLRRYGAGDIDFLIVRENTEGLFWSRQRPYSLNGDAVEDTLRISRARSERLFHAAFEYARRRRRKVTLVDKANVLPSMVFFRRIFQEIGEQYPDIQNECVYVDAMALFLVERPHSFDVIVTENMFGDILSDLAAGLVGGMGMAPSADLGDKFGVFQPSHGTAPSIAGKGIANPVATILSAAMMLEWLPGEHAAAGAKRIHDAVRSTLVPPEVATADLGGRLTTSELGERIAQAAGA